MATTKSRERAIEVMVNNFDRIKDEIKRRESEEDESGSTNIT